MDTIRVLIADDSAVARVRLERMLEGVDGIELVGSATDGTEGLAQLREHKPDVCLLDQFMPGMDGADVARQAHEEGLDTIAVLISGGLEGLTTTELRAAGIAASFEKTQVTQRQLVDRLKVLVVRDQHRDVTA